MAWKIFLNLAMLILALEEISTIIYTIFNRDISNIFLQIYPSLVLIGNFGFLMELLKNTICYIYKLNKGKNEEIDKELNIKKEKENKEKENNIIEKLKEEKKVKLFQFIYLSCIMLINLFILYNFDNKSFNENVIILFMNEKKKLQYINGYFGCLVNLMEIIDLIILIKEKIKQLNIITTNLNIKTGYSFFI